MFELPSDMRWESVPDASEWDALLPRFADCNVYQQRGWGEHKRQTGWQPLRLAARSGEETVALAQVTLRRYPGGVALAWVNGGPLGELRALDQSFRQAVRAASGARQLYLRLNLLRPRSAADARAMGELGWHAPSCKLLSGHSILLDLQPDEATFLKGMAGKHRYYVRKATKAPIAWQEGNTPQLRAQLAALTQALTAEKSMDLPEWDVASLEDLNASLPQGLHILVGSLDGAPVTGCLVLLCGDSALYKSAATLQRGREVSAAYAMLARLREGLRARGMRVLDFGGTHPGADSARGVDHFKNGFGGAPIECLGEWDWATPSLLRPLANRLIAWRRPAP